MSLLVIGSSGYIGSSLLAYLQTYLPCTSISPASFLSSRTILSMLASNEHSIFEGVSTIILLAAQVVDYPSNYFQSYYENLRITDIVLNSLITEPNPPTLVFLSTRLVYQGSESALLIEDAPKKPLTLYAAAKLSSEHLITTISHLNNIRYFVFRLGVPYGVIVNCRQPKHGTIPMFLNQLSSNNAITLFGDGSYRRTFTSIIDVCRFVSQPHFNTLPPSGIYNLPGEELSLSEASYILQKQYPSSQVTFQETYLHTETGSTVFDSTKYQSQFTLSPSQSFADWSTTL